GPVDPDTFMTTTYAEAITRRAPMYEAMSQWGVTVDAQEIAMVRTPADFEDLIAAAIERA
ncbi:MAG: ATPase, partial [Shimia sp.]